MQKKFLSNLAITLGANLLVKPIWILGIDRVFQNRLGLEAYGVYTNLFVFSLVFGLLLDFGINNYNTSSLARNPSALATQFLPLLSLKFLLAIAYVALTIISGWLYGFTYHQLWLLAVLSFNQCLAYVSTFFRSTLTGLQLYKTDAYISSVDRLTMVVGGGAVLLLAVFPITIDVFVYVQTIGYAMAVMISLFTLMPHLRHISFRIHWQELISVLQKSFPFALLALLMMLYTRSDVLLIKKIFSDGDTENGIYAQSTRLLDAVNMIAVLVSGLLLPMFSSMLKQRQSVTPMVKLAMLVLLVPAIMGVMFCYVFSEQIFTVLYHQHSFYHTRVFLWCISSVLPMCTMYIFGTLLTARGHMLLLIQTAIVALVFNVAANSYLIPEFGARGAAIIALLTHSIVAFSNMYFAITRMSVRISVLHIGKFPLFGVLCLGSLVFLSANIPSMLAVMLIYVFLSIGFVVILQIIDRETLKRAVKRLRA